MRRRAVYKAISWESISNAVCLGIAWLIFGNLGSCLMFTMACIIIKSVMYYYHESFWKGTK